MEDQGKRILLFVVLAAAIFVVFQWVSPKPKPAKTADTVMTPGEVLPSSASRVGQARADAEKPATIGAPTTVEPTVESTIKLESKGVDVTFSNLGGVVKEWRVRYDSFKGRDMDEPLFIGGGPGQGLVATNFFAGSTHVIPVGAPWIGEKVGDNAVRYTYRDDVLVIVKDFVLLPDDFLIKVKIDVSMAPGATLAQLDEQLAVSMYSTGDGVRAPLLRPACHIGGTAASVSPRSLIGNRREQTGRVRFVGFARKYDLIALSPKDEGRTDLGCFRAPLDGVPHGSQVDLIYPSSRLVKDQAGINRELVLYVGPKYFDRLEGADKIAGWATGYKSVIDLGWFSFIARPMLWLLHMLFNTFGNWGIAIILLTCLVKLATLYWTTKSMRSMKAMAALKPQMEEIQKRYPDDRQKQQQAQMELFKQHGVSPLAGCLPMLLQMPIWIALYRMLSSAGELHEATFIPGWLDDLTLPDPFYILPITLMGMMFLQSRLQPATGDSAQQKILMYGMPLMFGGMSLFFPSGLTVYIFTNTTLGIVHSLYMNRTSAASLAAAKAAASARAAKAAAKVETSKRIPVEVKQAKPVVAEVTDTSDDGDEGDDGERRGPDSSKGGANGGSRKRSQRRGKRR